MLVDLEEIDAVIEFVTEFKEKFGKVATGEIVVSYKNKKHSH
jgi:hypothetical protein